jgi:hypothetical protein
VAQLRLDPADLALIVIGPHRENPAVRALLGHVKALEGERTDQGEDLKVEVRRLRAELSEGVDCKTCGATVYR